MANKVSQSVKRLQINNANTVMSIAIAISSFVVVFSLIACKALLSQRGYQAKVIAKKEKARDQLKENLVATDPLISAYKGFVGTTSNALGGDPLGDGDRDGDNAKITLDALPSKYDFPALTSSLEKLLTQNNLKIDSIAGTDDEIAQASKQSSNSPAPIDMPFVITASRNYVSVQKLISVFEKSIRPFNIDSLKFSGSDKSLQVVITGKTYYQPEKDLTIKTEVIK